MIKALITRIQEKILPQKRSKESHLEVAGGRDIKLKLSLVVDKKSSQVFWAEAQIKSNVIMKRYSPVARPIFILEASVSIELALHLLRAQLRWNLWLIHISVFGFQFMLFRFSLKLCLQELFVFLSVSFSLNAIMQQIYLNYGLTLHKQSITTQISIIIKSFHLLSFSPFHEKIISYQNSNVNTCWRLTKFLEKKI